jgi:uncharacterized protein (DUF1330 family)
MILPLLLLLASAPSSAPAAKCEGPPVLMVVSGPTHDAPRMRAYGEAIAKSRLYQQLGGYYLNAPRPVAIFEGEPPKNLITLIVRFPCLANAKTFWNSKVYQEAIKPLRLNPSAGDYLVAVYPEAPLRPDMKGKVVAPDYRQRFEPGGIEQVEPIRK